MSRRVQLVVAGSDVLIGVQGTDNVDVALCLLRRDTGGGFKDGDQDNFLWSNEVFNFNFVLSFSISVK